MEVTYIMGKNINQEVKIELAESIVERAKQILREAEERLEKLKNEEDKPPEPPPMMGQVYEWDNEPYVLGSNGQGKFILVSLWDGYALEEPADTQQKAAAEADKFVANSVSDYFIKQYTPPYTANHSGETTTS